MPGGDRTGPRGLGIRTGRVLGYCAGYDAPGSTYGPGFSYGRGGGRGMVWSSGRGRGYGRGWDYREPIYPPIIHTAPVYTSRIPLEPVDKLAMLKQEKSYLESEVKGIGKALEDISKSIEELEKEE
ncbi:MAG: DUF5320 domain-containing protein [Candidatus Lokiarchaeota archaeon]|nr:DUF5320 domain-containing protein [Candidatus Lokiarchaeota archaeon]